MKKAHPSIIVVFNDTHVVLTGQAITLIAAVGYIEGYTAAQDNAIMENLINNI